ncbi:hypothetical protein ATN84_24835 [Paramesorhizobium deserti]|uniref:Protein kinase domain-containing protein n=1 Tax=Paramesorhizobium deserti TaxID=1494590 RepID=A0A135HXL4_9HYPH|nr:serine/threonine-protein kinase [Paramesorhizobium deserti]KXF77944.1 hypothetical protein ATN84_24835 [Paramesorhizobium deserti]
MMMDQIASKFAELWHVLTHDGDIIRDSEESRLLIDRVRAALDRGDASLATWPLPELIAGTFRIEELAHETSRVQVYRVRHRDLGTDYALKTLHPGEKTDHAIFADLLWREARIHLSVRHENVVTSYGALRLPDGRPGLLFEWMGGGSLLQSFSRKERLSIRGVRAIMRALLSGVQAIHAAGLVHADITPANLLFSGDGLASLKIADFSIARKRGSNSDLLEGAVRTRSSLASPECAAGNSPDERSDLYACGRILLLLLQHCEENGAIAANLAALARQLAHDNPDCRPQSAREAFTLLQMIKA